MILRLATTARNAAVQAVTDLLASGSTLEIYTGTPPATPQDAATGTLLATVTLGAFGAPSSGMSTGADPASVNAVATGTAGWCRIAGTSAATVLDGDVTDSAGSGFCKLSSTALTAGNPVDITSISLTMPQS